MRQEEVLEDAHPVVFCLSCLQLLAQVKGGCAKDAGKINDLVGHFSGRHRQKRASTAWLEADVNGRDQRGRIEEGELCMGTAEHAAMKALELIGILSVSDPKHLMSQIDHQGYPSVRKAALFRMECCLSFREAERLNRGRKGRRGEKAVDGQDQPPIAAYSSRHPCTMVVPTRGERTTSRESTREVCGRKNVHYFSIAHHCWCRSTRTASMCSLFLRALQLSDHLFCPDGRHLGIINMLQPLLLQAGFHSSDERYRRLYGVDYSYGTELHEEWCQDLLLKTRLSLPFLARAGMGMLEDLQRFMQRIEQEMYRPNFAAFWTYLTAFGVKQQ